IARRYQPEAPASESDEADTSPKRQRANHPRIPARSASDCIRPGRYQPEAPASEPVLMNRIDNLFSRLRSQNRRALMPFLTAGDPDLSMTAMLIAELVHRGAHLIEVGIPYSDPIADGPVIAASYHRALERGVKVSHIFQTLRTLRAEDSARFSDTPLVSMVSYAIIHRVGPERYLNEAATAGLDGLIVPDLPVEESRSLIDKATRRNLKLIQLITPTTPRERAIRIAQSTTGFVYYVSVAGITG